MAAAFGAERVTMGLLPKGAAMPIHDWSHVPAGLFHHFHQRWSGAICDGLNDGRLPEGYYALVEQHAVGVVPDVLTLHDERDGGLGGARPTRGGGLAIA